MQKKNLALLVLSLFMISGLLSNCNSSHEARVKMLEGRLKNAQEANPYRIKQAKACVGLPSYVKFILFDSRYNFYVYADTIQLDLTPEKEGTNVFFDGIQIVDNTIAYFRAAQAIVMVRSEKQLKQWQEKISEVITAEKTYEPPLE